MASDFFILNYKALTILQTLIILQYDSIWSQKNHIKNCETTGIAVVYARDLALFYIQWKISL